MPYAARSTLSLAVIAQSVWRHSRGWKVRGSTFFTPVQTGPAAEHYTRGTGPFPGVKQPGPGDYHPNPSSAKVTETVQLYIYSISGTSWPVLGKTLAYYLDFL